jgi:AcrR family transcriptional regulator
MPTASSDGRSERREEIIEVATRLFQQEGYHSTSLDDIADQMGFTKPALYYYFSGKEEILFEITERIVDASLAGLRAIVGEPGEPVEKFELALRNHLETLLKNVSAYAVFSRERGRLSPERERIVRDQERAYAQELKTVYAAGVLDGSFVDIDTEVAVGAILGACNWAFTWRRRDIPDDRLTEMLLQLVMRGFLAGSQQTAGKS